MRKPGISASIARQTPSSDPEYRYGMDTVERIFAITAAIGLVLLIAALAGFCSILADLPPLQ